MYLAMSGLSCSACPLVSLLGIEPRTPALEVWSLDHQGSPSYLLYINEPDKDVSCLSY